MHKRTLIDSLAVRVARTQKKAGSRPLLRWLGGPGAVTLALGGALSIGGITDGLGQMQFLVEKDLDAVRVVRQDGRVVAKLEDGFAANSVFKLSRVFPDRYVKRELSLFSDADWLPTAKLEQRDLFHTEMARINDTIREQFFQSSMPFGDLIHEKAAKYDVDPALVAAVIEQESRFKVRARSHVGAQGLMQLMPRTGRWMGADNLYDPEQNVDAGVKYLKYLERRFDGNLKKQIAAYNAGEGNVQRYNGVPPFRETQGYVKKVMRNYHKRNQQLKKYEQQQAGAPSAHSEQLAAR